MSDVCQLHKRLHYNLFANMMERENMTDEVHQQREEQTHNDDSLSRAERAELLELRKEKAERMREQQRVQAAQKQQAAAARARDEHIKYIQEKNRKIMEPDDDLRMPLGQKIVLICLAVLAAAILVIMRLSA